MQYVAIQMLGVVSTVIVLVAIYVFKYYQNVKRYPKGPTPLPLVGNLLSFEPHKLHFYAENCRKLYGDVFTIWAPRPIVMIMDVEIAREAYKGEDFLGRMGTFPDDILQCAENGGVIFSQGQNWREQRRAAIQIMRDFGMGKNQMEEQVRSSIEECMKHLDSLEDKSRVDFRWPIQILVANVINNVLYNYKYAFDDCEPLMNFANCLQDLIENIRKDVRTFLVMTFPWLRALPKQFGVEHFKRDVEPLTDQVRRDVKQSLTSYDENSEPECFVHAYMQKMKTNAFLNDEQMINVCMDFYLAGMETTSTTLRWGMLHMAANQDVQDKIRAELHAFNKDAPPTMADRPKLPYTNAAVHELQRIANILPLNVMHRTTVDTKVGGHSVPANTLNLAQIYSIHRDPTIFAEPEKFKPERFLMEDGKTPNKELLEYLNPFSMGKRQCAGEGLARMELLLGLSAILHKYRILPPLDAPLDISPIEASILLPKTNYLQMVSAH